LISIGDGVRKGNALAGAGKCLGRTPCSDMVTSGCTGILPLPLASLRSFAVGQDDRAGRLGWPD